MTEKALARLVHLHSGEETEDDWADYEDWKAADPEHRRAADRAESLWQKLGPALARRRVKPKSLPVVLLIAAGLTALLIGSGLFEPPLFIFADQRTAVGERRTVTLTDGSQVDIDSETAFDVNVDNTKRELTLHTGRIFVSVTPDNTRPFTIKAGNGIVRALGTAFSVHHEDKTTQIVVTESAVRINYPDGNRNQDVDVSAGQQVDYSPKMGIGKPRSADLRVLTAWRNGQMIFEGRPLGDVIAEMSRYRWGMIVFADASLKQLPVTGIFDTDDTDGLLNAIAAVLPLKVQKGPGITVIQRDGTRVPR